MITKRFKVELEVEGRSYVDDPVDWLEIIGWRFRSLLFQAYATTIKPVSGTVKVIEQPNTAT